VSVTPPKTDSSTDVKPSIVFNDGYGTCSLSSVRADGLCTSTPSDIDSKRGIDEQTATRLMGELEQKNRSFAEDQLTSAYYSVCGCPKDTARKWARNDLDALDGYFKFAGYEQRDRILAYRGLATGLKSGEVTLKEFREELADLCTIRAAVSMSGSVGTCDKANIMYDKPLESCRGSARCLPASGPLRFDNFDSFDFNRWLYGKGGSRHPGGGQLSEKTAGQVRDSLEGAFYQIAKAHAMYQKNFPDCSFTHNLWADPLAGDSWQKTMGNSSIFAAQAGRDATVEYGIQASNVVRSGAFTSAMSLKVGVAFGVLDIGATVFQVGMSRYEEFDFHEKALVVAVEAIGTAADLGIGFGVGFVLGGPLGFGAAVAFDYLTDGFTSARQQYYEKGCK
jgi:hypothetical protein